MQAGSGYRISSFDRNTMALFYKMAKKMVRFSVSNLSV